MGNWVLLGFPLVGPIAYENIRQQQASTKGKNKIKVDLALGWESIEIKNKEKREVKVEGWNTNRSVKIKMMMSGKYTTIDNQQLQDSVVPVSIENFLHSHSDLNPPLLFDLTLHLLFLHFNFAGSSRSRTCHRQIRRYYTDKTTIKWNCILNL